MSAPAIRMPFETGPIHFVGIGGIGMSGIAEVLLNLGYAVTGSDMRDSAAVERLRDFGAVVYIGHKAEQVAGAGALVVSSAIKGDNPELVEARARSIPVVRRAEMLAELMRLRWAVAVGGTHGKTTTTTMIAALMEGGGLDPTVINGGIINAYGSNAKLGLGDWMVVEADESDGSFLKLYPTVAVVTNIDPEHMEHYGEFEALRAAFDTFIENLPFYGFAVLCIDHPEVQSLVARVTDRRVITYGFNPQADVRAENVRLEATGTRFDVVFRSTPALEGDAPELRWADLFLPMAGRHNTQNVLSAIAVSRELGLSEDEVRRGLGGFGGVRRRFTHVGDWNGVTIIDDYGHHPVEIAAVLQAARQVAKGRVHAVVQPHRYTRLSHHFEDFSTCFNDADTVLVTDVYAAGEDPITGASGPDLVASLGAHGHRNAGSVSRESLVDVLRPHLAEGDLVVLLGAGDITAWAAELPERLAG